MELRQWHVYLADFRPHLRKKTRKWRPVVVIQTESLNREHHPSVIVCLMTSKIHYDANILRVHLQTGEANLRRAYDVMVDQIQAIDRSRFRTTLGPLNLEDALSLKRNLKLILDF